LFKKESLQNECDVDPMDAEQTWPTEEELAEAIVKRKITKVVPRGISEYQASWIPDEDGGIFCYLSVEFLLFLLRLEKNI